MQFNTEYNKTNAIQREAIDQIEGVVVVNSGPGSGKTQMFALRVANILIMDIQQQARNILCLTYTNAGVKAIRERLYSFIGIQAYEVNIFTFHSLCSNIIQYHPAEFGLMDFEPVTELEQYEILCEIIDELPADNVLKRLKGDSYYEAKRMKNLYQMMKQEYWSSDHIKQKSLEYIKSLPEREEYIYKKANSKKNILPGDLKIDAIAKESDKMQTLMAAAELFNVYNEKLYERKRYDFSDMISIVVTHFKKELEQEAAGHLSHGILAKQQEQFQYILVDEFQDTTGSQLEFLKLLVDFWEIPNLFVVGDADQTIYEFAGARAKNFEWALSFLDVKVLNTEQNYRSKQSILSAAHNLISNNKIRYNHNELVANV